MPDILLVESCCLDFPWLHEWNARLKWYDYVLAGRRIQMDVDVSCAVYYSFKLRTHGVSFGDATYHIYLCYFKGNDAA